MSLPRLSPQRVRRRCRVVSGERSRGRPLRRVQPTAPLDDAPQSRSPGCIDLTNDDSFSGGNVIDLTSVNDSPVVLLSPVDGDRRRGGSRRRSSRLTTSYSSEDLQVTSSRTRMQRMIDIDSDDSPPPFDVTKTPNSNDRPELNVTAVSPAAEKTYCPVCLDDARQILRSGRQMFSTVCGHIYCDKCITTAVNTQRCCPTCRKRLTLKQVHVLYL